MSRSVAIQLALLKDHQRIWCVSRPRRRPDSRYSTEYCLWLARNGRQRYEVLSRQKFKCWECGSFLGPRWMHLHHPHGYDNLRYEEASDLAGVHASCHRRIHDRIRDAFQRIRSQAACGCKAA
jgi:hypothetical protein